MASTSPFSQRLVEVGAAALNVDGVERAVGDALLDQRCRELEPDGRAGRDRDLLALDVVPLVEGLALAGDHVLRRGADTHDANHAAGAVGECDREVGRPDRSDVERAREDRASVRIARELDELDLDALGPAHRREGSSARDERPSGSRRSMSPARPGREPPRQGHRQPACDGEGGNAADQMTTLHGLLLLLACGQPHAPVCWSA